MFVCLFFFYVAAANSYELNNLNNDALDAPIYNNPVSNSQQIDGDNNQNFNSLPCETFLVACKTESDLSSGNRNFNHNNPLYQSAQVQSKNNSDNFVLPKASECYIDILLVTIKCLNSNFISLSPLWVYLVFGGSTHTSQHLFLQQKEEKE